MFTQDFFPTPPGVIEAMLEGLNLKGKTVLEPSAGKGNIADALLNHGAEVIACENNQDLKKILHGKCKIIADDFLTVESHQVSHVDLIVMNPPFTADERHILHAYSIAPAGCKVIALCNTGTIENAYSKTRQELKSIINTYGIRQDLGECFAEAERVTRVKVSLLKLQKPGANYSSEFEGFFLEDDPEEDQANGLMSYNVVRDLVNRYVAAIKLYDSQIATGLKMNDLLNGFYGESLTFSCTEKGAPKLRNDFKKDMQKAGWKFIFEKMDMARYATRGLREDINKFVEQQTEVPFTMRNIYKMLQIVVGTQEQRMDKALLEVFDKLTEHHHDNRFNVPGWKTNSHYLVNKRFIFPYAAELDYNKDYVSVRSYRGDAELIRDTEKALCFITGENYDSIIGTYHLPNRMLAGQWYPTHFFKVKGFKKGTLHCEFNSEDLWAKFNQRIAKLKGYPLFEPKDQTAYQDRQTGRDKQEKANPAHAYKPSTLFV